MNSDPKKTLEGMMERRRRIQEIFWELWQAIIPRYFPEYEHDVEYADFVLNEIIGEIEDGEAYEEAKRKGLID
jgi:hypothetical protein